LGSRSGIEHGDAGLGNSILSLRGAGSRQERIPPDLIALIADGQLIAAFQIALQNAGSVNANAVGAAQIPDDQGFSDLSNTAMATGNLRGFELDVTFRVPAQKQDRFI
jgi:hypothetical protein